VNILKSKFELMPKFIIIHKINWLKTLNFNKASKESVL